MKKKGAVMERRLRRASGRTPSADGARDDRGASLVEYALLVALIAIACIVAVTYFGGETGDTYSRVSSSVEGT